MAFLSKWCLRDSVSGDRNMLFQVSNGITRLSRKEYEMLTMYLTYVMT